MRLATPLLLCALLLAGCGEDSRDTHILLIEQAAAVERSDMADMALRQGMLSLGAQGDLVPGIAERWTVSDDGLSYLFRLGDRRWSDGERIEADTVEQALRDALADAVPVLGDALGSVRDVRAMTDKVIEVRLHAPVPAFLDLLAHPAMGLEGPDGGSGRYAPLLSNREEDGVLTLVATPQDGEEQAGAGDRVTLETATAELALERYRAGEVDMVTGGTFATVALAKQAAGTFAAPRYDPVLGLFGIVPARPDPLIDDPAVRRSLSAAIDRDAFVAALDIPELAPRTGFVQGREAAPPNENEAAAPPSAPPNGDGSLRLTIDLPEGPGGDLLFERLATDWGRLGYTLERDAEDPMLRLVDQVAPSADPAWFLDRFRCSRRPVCAPEADSALDAAVAARTRAERLAALRQASRSMREAAIFMPITAPVRWTLASPQLSGFVPNRFGRHDPGMLRDTANEGY